MKSSHRKRVVAIIPARFGSQRLPGKPLAEIAGKPMVVHVMEHSAQAELVDDVIVATDDQRIADAVRRYGGAAVLTPVDARSGTDRIAVVARTLWGVDIVVNVQGDEPLIPPAMIDQAISPMLKDPKIHVSTLVKRIGSVDEYRDPSIPKVVLDQKRNCMYFSRCPIPYGRDVQTADVVAQATVYRHIGLYVFRNRFLRTFASLETTPLERVEKLEQLRVLEHGYIMRAVETEYDSLSVDTPEDLERARAVMRSAG
jgi:3-deoxy-manno-octulosonate cytidylyltransferase (CMP-KDO synthetase)